MHAVSRRTIDKRADFNDLDINPLPPNPNGREPTIQSKKRADINGLDINPLPPSSNGREPVIQSRKRAINGKPLEVTIEVLLATDDSIYQNLKTLSNINDEDTLISYLKLYIINYMYAVRYKFRK